MLEQVRLYQLTKKAIFIQNKWKYIRDYYVRMRKKRALGLTTCRTKKEEERLWNLSFLDSAYLLQNEALSNISNFSETSQSEETDILQNVEQTLEERASPVIISITSEAIANIKQEPPDGADENQSQENQSQENQSQELASDSDVSSDSTTEETPKLKRRKLASQEELLRIIDEKCQQKILECMLSEKEMKKNHIQMFCNSLAATMETFPPSLVAEAKARLFSIISELEIKNAKS